MIHQHSGSSRHTYQFVQYTHLYLEQHTVINLNYIISNLVDTITVVSISQSVASSTWTCIWSNSIVALLLATVHILMTLINICQYNTHHLIIIDCLCNFVTHHHIRDYHLLSYSQSHKSRQSSHHCLYKSENSHLCLQHIHQCLYSNRTNDTSFKEILLMKYWLKVYISNQYISLRDIF